MIVSKIRGGLGNQLFIYAAGRALSIYHKAPFILDISWYKTGPRPFLLDQFNIQGVISTKDHSGAEDGIGYNQKQWNFYKEFLEYDGYRFLSGWWQSEEFFKSAANIIKNDLTLKSKTIIEEAIDNLNIIKSNKKNIVSVHYRRGDYVPLAEQGLFYLLNDSYYDAAISRFNNDTVFLFFSDDIECCKQSFSSPLYRFCEVEDTLLSLAMMQNCDHHIISNSSFSWWAAWLGEKDGKRTISPKSSHWFGPKNPQYETDGIIPKRWIQLSTEPTQIDSDSFIDHPKRNHP